jgi:putative endonuclease
LASQSFFVRNAVETKTEQGLNEDRTPTNHSLQPFHYVYILVSETDESRHYTGLTQDLETHLQAHNAGQVPHTTKYRPWRIETAISFRSREKAAAFERYLKSHSGRAFATKHF